MFQLLKDYTTYKYTAVGKGTTSRLWKEVSHETEIYQVLWRAQGSAIDEGRLFTLYISQSQH